jgi:hypothetical protein
MYEYLCLYVNAFSFQAVISRRYSGRQGLVARNARLSRLPSMFPRVVMGSPNGRYVFEGIRAAKVVLKLMGEIDAAACLRYMPSRYYLFVDIKYLPLESTVTDFIISMALLPGFPLQSGYLWRLNGRE